MNINECYSLPCENHGICTDLINGFNCECAPGFDGKTCHDNIDECRSEPCLNKVITVDEKGLVFNHTQNLVYLNNFRRTKMVPVIV